MHDSIPVGTKLSYFKNTLSVAWSVNAILRHYGTCLALQITWLFDAANNSDFKPENLAKTSDPYSVRTRNRIIPSGILFVASIGFLLVFLLW